MRVFVLVFVGHNADDIAETVIMNGESLYHHVFCWPICFSLLYDMTDSFVIRFVS